MFGMMAILQVAITGAITTAQISIGGSGQDETDSDGIGDTQYVIDDNNRDRYPLMGQFNTFDVGTWNGEECNDNIVSNSTVSNF